jgi:hypothetical protein
MEKDLKSSSKQLLQTLVSMNDKLKSLKDDKKLSQEEERERQFVMLVRRLQIENPGVAAIGIPQPEGDTPKESTSVGEPIKKRSSGPKTSPPKSGDASKKGGTSTSPDKGATKKGSAPPGTDKGPPKKLSRSPAEQGKGSK